jgi:hypothetical protein
LESQTAFGLRCMFDDLLAGDIVPIFEPIAGVNIAGRKQRLHKVLR